MKVQAASELSAYRKAFALQQAIFHVSQRWPREEAYSLTDQIRRASRSVGANLTEAWAKRRYPAHFLAKLTDADGELAETGHWLNTALACHYLDATTADQLLASQRLVGRLLGSMIRQYVTFCPPVDSEARCAGESVNR